MKTRMMLFSLAPVLLFAGTGAYAVRQGRAGPMTAAPGSAVAVLAGGCYWGAESVYRHVRGVTSVTSGFAVPATSARGETAPAEAVRLVYDPTRISYHRILDIFFSVVHDPTQVNRQGPDVGPEYRSVVFVGGAAQRAAVRAYIDSLAAAHVYQRPIATQIDSLQAFEAVDPSQQNYAENHQTSRYIQINDVPKIKALAQRFPTLYRN
jgi:peptide-methionine (S)-S-oxide reductase